MYSVIFENENKKNAIIKMPSEVLGGLDAMNFINEIAKIPNETENVILDMFDLNLINSSGFGMLTNAYVKLSRRKIKISLANVSDEINKLLEMTKLNTIFNVI
jgi:anti-anti-sigma factor